MNTDRIKWMAALPYLMVLVIVLNGDVLGNYSINIFGLKLSFYTFLPFIIYHFVNRNHENQFISTHVNRAMSYFIKYFIISVLLSVTLTIFGFGVLTFDPIAIFTSGILGLVFLLPFLLIVVWVIVKSVVGSIRAFKLQLPNKQMWHQA